MKPSSKLIKYGIFSACAVTLVACGSPSHRQDVKQEQPKVTNPSKRDDLSKTGGKKDKTNPEIPKLRIESEDKKAEEKEESSPPPDPAIPAKNAAEQPNEPSSTSETKGEPEVSNKTDKQSTTEPTVLVNKPPMKTPVVETPPAVVETPIVVETPPTVVEIPVVVETPPTVVETPVVVETPPTVVETPVVVETPSAETETPVVVETPPTVVETPVVVETPPTVVETPIVVETPPTVVETPVVVETPIVVETPPTETETPVVIETSPAETETPAKKNEYDVLYDVEIGKRRGRFEPTDLSKTENVNLLEVSWLSEEERYKLATSKIEPYLLGTVNGEGYWKWPVGFSDNLVKAWNDGVIFNHDLFNQHFLKLVNDHRTGIGRVPLTDLDYAAEAAEVRSEELATIAHIRVDNLAHVRLDKRPWSTVFDEIDMKGAKPKAKGENVAFQTVWYNYYWAMSEKNLAEFFFELWINSKGHRANIESDWYLQQGISVRMSTLEESKDYSGNAIIATNIFIHDDGN